MRKEHYYPKTSFMEAKVGYKPIFVWRSLMATKDIVEKDARWNIGKGSKVRIWDDLWVVGQDEKLIRPSQCEINFVRDLMASNHHGWNEEFICNIFENPITKKILGMFYYEEEDDTLFWERTTNGDFSLNQLIIW